MAVLYDWWKTWGKAEASDDALLGVGYWEASLFSDDFFRLEKGKKQAE
jgi:hypothetical protein